jgi:hypothetical protein
MVDVPCRAGPAQPGGGPMHYDDAFLQAVLEGPKILTV